MATSFTSAGIVWDATNSPAQASGTGSSNTLDDYEEGTFVPHVEFGGSVANDGSRSGNYRKIGAVVICHITIQSISKASLSGSVTISPLPFTCSSGGEYSQCPIRWAGITTTTQISALITNTWAYLAFQALNTAGYYAPVTNSHFAGTANIYGCTATYSVAT
jgi:hypothetical protein